MRIGPVSFRMFLLVRYPVLFLLFVRELWSMNGVTLDEMRTSSPLTTDKLMTTTDTKPMCRQQTNSQCPKMWYPVDSNLCLMVFPGVCEGITKEHNCKDSGSYILKEQLSNNMRSCLAYLLQNSTINWIILDNNAMYSIRTGETYNYQWYYCVACVLDTHKFEQPVIRSFYIETWAPVIKRHHLLNSSLSYIISERGPVHIFCNVTGYPRPKVIVMFSNVTQVSSTIKYSYNSIRGNMSLGDCPKSGVYTCQVESLIGSVEAQTGVHFSAKISMPSFIINLASQNLPQVRSGNDQEMRCSANGCPKGIVLSIINDINQTLASVSGRNSLVHMLRGLQCYDMGTYYCRAGYQDGHFLEEKADLAVYRCPVHLCRGEKAPKVISFTLNQTLSFTVCLMSEDKLSWENNDQTNKTAVDFLKRMNTHIYWSATITIFDIAVKDYGTKTIRITNSHGHLDYTVVLQNKNDPSQENNTVWVNVGVIAGAVVCAIVVTLATVIILKVIKEGTRRGEITPHDGYVFPYTPYVVIADGETNPHDGHIIPFSPYERNTQSETTPPDGYSIPVSSYEENTQSETTSHDGHIIPISSYDGYTQSETTPPDGYIIPVAPYDGYTQSETTSPDGYIIPVSPYDGYTQSETTSPDGYIIPVAPYDGYTQHETTPKDGYIIPATPYERNVRSNTTPPDGYIITVSFDDGNTPNETASPNGYIIPVSPYERNIQNKATPPDGYINPISPYDGNTQSEATPPDGYINPISPYDGNTQSEATPPDGYINPVSPYEGNTQSKTTPPDGYINPVSPYEGNTQSEITPPDGYIIPVSPYEGNTQSETTPPDGYINPVSPYEGNTQSETTPPDGYINPVSPYEENRQSETTPPDGYINPVSPYEGNSETATPSQDSDTIPSSPDERTTQRDTTHQDVYNVPYSNEEVNSDSEANTPGRSVTPYSHYEANTDGTHRACQDEAGGN